jgi:hypothetical protein
MFDFCCLHLECERNCCLQFIVVMHFAVMISNAIWLDCDSCDSSGSLLSACFGSPLTLEVALT